jgi:hypothetical protein
MKNRTLSRACGLLVAFALLSTGCNGERPQPPLPFGAGGFKLTNKDKNDADINAWWGKSSSAGEPFTGNPIKKDATGKAPADKKTDLTSIDFTMDVAGAGERTIAIKVQNGVAIKGLALKFTGEKDKDYVLTGSMFVYDDQMDATKSHEETVTITLPK